MLTWLQQPSERRTALPASVPNGLRIYAVGDVHGRLDLLGKLHELIVDDWRAQPARAAEVIYLGDYVDRGPQSAGVLDLLSGPSPTGLPSRFLKGNHEEMLAEFLANPEAGAAWRRLGGLETLLSYRVDVAKGLAEKGIERLSQDLKSHMPERHRAFLTQLASHAAIGGYFFCHAGVRPGVPLASQSPRDLLWIRDEFLSCHDDFGRIVVHGHSPVETPEFRFNRINIDTGAYATGVLTALVLEHDGRRVLQAR